MSDVSQFPASIDNPGQVTGTQLMNSANTAGLTHSQMLDLLSSIAANLEAELLAATVITANTTAQAFGRYFANASGGALTVTLPSAPHTGSPVGVVKTDSSGHGVTVSCPGGETFPDGSTSVTITSQDVGGVWIWDGVYWVPQSAQPGAYVGTFDPDNYGAGAYGTDSSAAIQSALNAAQPGGWVIFKRPLTAQGLVWPSRVQIMTFGVGSDVFSDTDATLPPAGAFLQLVAGSSQDLLKTQYFDALETGTTLNGAQATNTGTLTVHGTAAPPANNITTWFPSAGTLTVNGLTLTYTGVTVTSGQVTAFTGVTGGNSTVQADGTAVMLNSSEEQVPSRLAINGHLVLDGNKYHGSTGRCLVTYCKDYTVDGIIVQNSGADGWYSDSDHNAGYDHETQVSNFRVTDNAGNGINWQGTHDSQFVNGYAARNGASGIVEGVWGGNLSFTNVHNWGNGAYNWDMQCATASHVNCQSDGVGLAGIRLAANYVQWKGGNIYGTNLQTGAEVLVQVGNGAAVALNVFGCDFDAVWSLIGPGSVPIAYADDGHLVVRVNKFRGTMQSATAFNRYIAYGQLVSNASQPANAGSLTFDATKAVGNIPNSGSIRIAIGGTGYTITYTGMTNSGGVITLTGCTGGPAGPTIVSGQRVLQTETQALGGLGTPGETWLLDEADGNNTALYQIGNLGDGNSSTAFDGRNAVQFSGTVLVKHFYEQLQTLGASGAVTIDSSKANVARVTLAANATSSSIINAQSFPGQFLTIQWVQDATGGRTYVWPANCKFAGNTAPAASTAANTVDSVTFRWNGSGGNWEEVSRAIGVPV